MLGDEREFELEWASIYQFACRRIDNFRKHRVLFAGDSAHQVSPFGARGANTGVQDADNLAWKLKLVLDGLAPESLIDSYNEERAFAADDNLLNSTRSTDFITPKSESSRYFRDAVLELAEHYDFARPLVNSGRLSMPTPYVNSSLNTVDEDDFPAAMAPGTNCDDAPLKVNGSSSWFLNLIGDGFKLLHFGPALQQKSVDLNGISASIINIDSKPYSDVDILTERYDGQPGTTYLIRPDQHVAARWRQFDEDKVRTALARATGQA